MLRVLTKPDLVDYGAEPRVVGLDSTIIEQKYDCVNFSAALLGSPA